MGIIEGGSSPLCFSPTLCSGRDDGQSLEMSNVKPWHQRSRHVGLRFFAFSTGANSEI